MFILKESNGCYCAGETILSMLFGEKSCLRVLDTLGSSNLKGLFIGVTFSVPDRTYKPSGCVKVLKDGIELSDASARLLKDAYRSFVTRFFLLSI